MNSVGFIGLGHMGFPMVLNLLEAGFQVKAYDINHDVLSDAVKEGAERAHSIQELCKEVDAVITMLQTGKQVQSCILGSEGIFTSLKKDAIYIDSSSIDIESSKKLHALAEQHGVNMLDAPVSGGVAGAQSASLTFMVGGDEQTFRRAKIILSKLGKNIIYAGPAGCGAAAKICNNMILGVSMIAVSEAFQLAEKLGLSGEKLFEICSKSSAQCWSLTSYCPWPGIMPNVPSSNHYEPGFTANMMLKDLNLAQNAAQGVKVETELGKHATRLYQKFVDNGHGQVDFSGILLFHS